MEVSNISTEKQLRTNSSEKQSRTSSSEKQSRTGSSEKQLRTNERIRSKEVRLIDADGSQRGVVSIQEALTTAQTAGLDLVEISPNAEPPVCRVMDFGKHLFQLKKKKADAKKKQHKVQLKELKYRPGIEEGDYKTKLKKLLMFIEEGDKVKVTIRYRGREVAHHELGADILKRIEIDSAEVALVEQMPKFEGRQVVMILAPKKKQ